MRIVALQLFGDGLKGACQGIELIGRFGLSDRGEDFVEKLASVPIGGW